MINFMKETRLLMGMPITVEIADSSVDEEAIDKIFEYFKYVDEKFSTHKETSEITKINNGGFDKEKWSEDMKTVFLLSEQTKKETDGYFDIVANDGKYNPSGLVKGWAILNAAELLRKMGFKNYYVEAGGDIQAEGKNNKGDYWRIGIRNPFKIDEIVKVVSLKDNEGIATSGTYMRGDHIYNPKNRKEKITEIVSLTVIGPNVYEADRFATAAFAMGKKGIEFIEKLSGFEGYMIDRNGVATKTANFEKYVAKNF